MRACFFSVNLWSKNGAPRWARPSNFLSDLHAARSAGQGLRGPREPCYDDPPDAPESNDQASSANEQVFPDYDQYDPGPVYD